MAYPRPCRRCEETFQPTSRTNFCCDKCLTLVKKETAKKNRERERKTSKSKLKLAWLRKGLIGLKI